MKKQYPGRCYIIVENIIFILAGLGIWKLAELIYQFLT